MNEQIDDIHDLRVVVWGCGNQERFAGRHIYREAKRQGLNVQFTLGRARPEIMSRTVADMIQSGKKPHWILNLVIRPQMQMYYRWFRREGIRQAWLYHDQLNNTRTRMWNELIQYPDVVMFSQLHNADLYRNGSNHVLWIPQYFNAERCKANGSLPERLDPNKDQYDFCFIGHYDRRRSDWLGRLSKHHSHFLSQKIRMRGIREVFGYNMANIYAQSKIAVNIQWASFVKDHPFLCSNRAYNAMGSGCFFINHYVKQMELLWQEGVHCVTYNDKYEELEAKIRFWLRPENEAKREEIARAGQEDVLKYHTLERRIPQYWRIMLAIQNGEDADLEKWSFEQQGKFVTRNW